MVLLRMAINILKPFQNPHKTRYWNLGIKAWPFWGSWAPKLLGETTRFPDDRHGLQAIGQDDVRVPESSERMAVETPWCPFQTKQKTGSPPKNNDRAIALQPGPLPEDLLQAQSGVNWSAWVNWAMLGTGLCCHVQT